MFFRIALIGLIAIGAFAQTFRGNIAGVVTDSSGAALPNASVRLDSPATGLTRTTVSAANGDFLFPELPVGMYTVTVTNPGFEVKKVDNIEVAVSRTTNIPVQLGVAQQQSMVEVSASAATLETTSSALVAVVNNETVKDLPINGRDFKQMVKLAPGVTTGNSVNGARTSGINYQIDGVDNNDSWFNIVSSNQTGVAGIAGALVPVDAIDQFSMQSNAAADVGRNGGGNINMVIKSGTNDLHGSLYYFNRNEALADPSPILPAGSKPQEIRNNQFGFAAGGPIIKNRTFFFVAGEIQLAIAANSALDTSPSAAWVSQAQGVLTKYNVPVNQVSLNLLNIWPAATRTGPATANNYLSNGVNTYNSFNGIAKVDHRFNDKHSLSLRYFGGAGTQVADVGSHYKDFFQQAPMHVHNISVVENWVISPTMVNQVTLGTNYFMQIFDDYNIGFDPATYGLITGASGGIYTGAPTLKISGFDYVGATQPAGRIDTTGHITDNLSYTRGRHQFKFGGEFRRAVVDSVYFNNARGTFNFDGTRGPWASDSTVSSSLKSLADYLAGMPSNSNGALIVRGNQERTYLVNSGEAWMHDTMQINPKLSVNFGLRYTYQGVIHDKDNSITSFVPAQGFVVGTMYNKQLDAFAPRFGFAYTPKRDGKTVVRGGYGIYYDVPSINLFASNTSGNGAATGANANPAGPIPIYTLSATNVIFQSGVPVFGGATPKPPFGAYGVNPNFRLGYIQNYNLNVQQQFTKSTIFQLAYVGSLGRKLPVPLDINQPVNGVRPYAAQYPTLGAINQLNSVANSNYNSLQASIRQQMWKGLAANFYYTWAHALDDASSGTTLPTNSYSLRNEYGSSTFDFRHTATGFLSYDAPQIAKFAPRLTKGWQFNSLVTFTSGPTLNVLAGTNVSGTGEGRDRANVVGNPFANVPVLTNTRAVQYFNPAAFAKPATGTFGNYGRDAIYGPGFGSVDFSIFKNTPITERIHSQFRVEIFNLFNRTNWATPNVTYTSSTFGQLTQTKAGSSAPGLGFGEPRNVQLALKITF